MNVNQALEYANAFYIPEFIFAGGYESIEAERIKGEEALKALLDEWRSTDKPSFSFDIVRELADRNRGLCDAIGEARLRNIPSSALARSLSDADICAGIGAMQGRSAAAVAREVRGDRDAYAVAYVRKPIKGNVLGIDIETTGTAPERGYILNVGWETMELASDSVPQGAEAVFCGLPEDPYRESGVPLQRIHGISWDMVEGKTQFRENQELQERLLSLMLTHPIMAHNAAFEDSWFMLHLKGYAEARQAGKITIIDSRDICRRLDGEVNSLPRESAPAALENWARRRGTLSGGESERHLGLEDADLMLRTVQAEMNRKGMFAR
ncbi:3'-5' exonuclease [Collinsella sp. AGMB00827]|uniref:3'-5' exonuclease n=1 Tax=Collinsella ureilytica TaxID=2869515 RepID=A0ABS7MHT4_9ACTN|nr:3'-5' exonuclease [Collinsella urealyticum]MBY4796932.1 3'-5' exonuclease [Collinsella urealyticum]